VRAKAIGIGLALAVIAALSVPMAAAAKRHEAVYSSFRLHGSNGYVVEVNSFDGAPIQLNARKHVPGSRGFLGAEYSPPHTRRTATEMEASLGRLGRIDVHFVERSRREEPVPPHCKGSPTIVEKGFFVGAIHFHGEDGFTRVDAGRAPGSVSHEPPVTCHGHRAEPSEFFGGSATTEPQSRTMRESGETESLSLIAGTSDRRRTFVAVRLMSELEDETTGPSLGGVFYATDSGHVGPVPTVKSAFTFSTSPRSFLSPDPDHPLTAATVEPPAPFTGSASFTLTSPTTDELRGELAVELPGEGAVPLVHGFAAGMCANRRCTKTVPPALRPGDIAVEVQGVH
jgi:hypothetical protein